MMAPAVTDEQTKYIDLASNGAQLRRALLPDEYPRLAQVVPVVGNGEVHLTFRMDDRKRPEVSARVLLDCALECQMCLEAQARKLELDFVALLAKDEAQATSWSQLDEPDDEISPRSVAVVGAELDIAALVEDEILLQLPANVCVDPDCEHRPQLSFPADAAGLDGDPQQLSEEAGRTNPFDVLRSLKGKVPE